MSQIKYDCDGKVIDNLRICDFEVNPISASILFEFAKTGEDADKDYRAKVRLTHENLHDMFKRLFNLADIGVAAGIKHLGNVVVDLKDERSRSAYDELILDEYDMAYLICLTEIYPEFITQNNWIGLKHEGRIPPSNPPK